jgi:CNT family concentrative nucleoside transporter
VDFVGVLRGFIGIAAFLGIAFALSKKKKDINWKLVMKGIALQIVIGIFVLNPVVKQNVFDPVDKAVSKLLDFSKTGSNFVMQSVEKHEITVFENVKDKDGKTKEVPVKKSIVGTTSPGAMTFAFWILPTVVFFSSIMTLLYYFGVMQPIVRIIAKVVQKIMGTSGSETTSCSANIFMGQTEAPLVVKPFVHTMTKSELHAVMVGGFATVAGGVLAMYAAILQGIPGIAGHLVTASCMAAPGALYISKIVFPETEESDTMGDIKIEIEQMDTNMVEAASRGATEGMQLLINIVAMLISFVALVAMFDWCILAFTTFLHGYLSFIPAVSFTDILGWIFYPFAFLMGIPLNECGIVGGLLGKKIVLTELLAYLDLSGMVSAGTISTKAQIICSYALCGFANFASIGIQIGGIGGIAPERRKDLAQLGVSAMVAGVIVTCITGTIAGIFMSFGY